MKLRFFALLLLTSVLSAQDEIPDQVKEVENAKVLSVSVFAHSTDTMPGSDEKAIPIPEGWRRYSHIYFPKQRSGQFYTTPAWVVANPNDPSKESEVRIRVDAYPAGGVSWISAELVVVIVPE
jgi:hypothetical protein